MTNHAGINPQKVTYTVQRCAVWVSRWQVQVQQRKGVKGGLVPTISVLCIQMCSQQCRNGKLKVALYWAHLLETEGTIRCCFSPGSYKTAFHLSLQKGI